MQTRNGTRHSVTLAGRYWIGRSPAREVAVRDLSPRGCKLVERFSALNVGTLITLEIGSHPPIRGTVRWQHRGGVVGVQFQQAIDPASLAG